MSTSISRSVQFVGVSAVVKAYQNKNVAPWAIFCNNQFMFNYSGKKISEGVKILSDTLEAIQDADTPAIYTLKVYEDLVGKIKSNTPDNGSFNFRVSGGSAADYRGAQSISNKELLDELKGIHLRIDRMQESEIDEGDSIGQIERVMKIPGVSEIIGAAVSMLTGGVAPRALAGVPDTTHNELSAEADQIYLSESVLQSLQILLRADPNLESHLAKLAAMSRNEPGKFNMLIGML